MNTLRRISTESKTCATYLNIKLRPSRVQVSRNVCTGVKLSGWENESRWERQGIPEIDFLRAQANQVPQTVQAICQTSLLFDNSDDISEI